MSFSIGPAAGGAGYGNLDVSSITDKIQSKLGQLDVNKDGAIERFEADSVAGNSNLVDNLFSRVDTDADGLITQEEQTAAIDRITDKLNQFNSISSVDTTQLLLQQLTGRKDDSEQSQNPFSALSAYQSNSF